MKTQPDRIVARYLAHCSQSEMLAMAQAIALEQTVEVPDKLVTSPFVRKNVVGRIDSVNHAGGVARIQISYNPDLASRQLGQLVNLLYGNVSLYDQLRLAEVSIPDALADAIGGPAGGIESIRELTGVFSRPLLATVVKPRGSSLQRFADIAYQFALGGGDILKDDQNLVHATVEDFKRHVDTVADAVARANEETGRHCLYFPHVAGSGQVLARQARYVALRQLPGFLICPVVTGLETAKTLARENRLLMMAHPSLAGAFTEPPQHGIAMPILQGLLYRLAGADISIFPGQGGRISNSDDRCERTVAELTRALGTLRPSLPCPAGGKTLEDIPHLTEAYGEDAMLLFGGALLGHDADLAESTRIFSEAIQSGFQAEQRQPGTGITETLFDDESFNSEVIRKGLDFRWQGRIEQAYKPDQSLPHGSAVRVGLFGEGDERIGFALRYFELKPGGFTSLEQHFHAHVVIAVCGKGVLQFDDTVTHLRPHDIAYLAPRTPHQLRNESSDVFGFYCVVDRDRDRPVEMDG